jgi:uncharacterized membrane protein
VVPHTSEKNKDQPLATADPTLYNVEAIARLERDALLQRSTGERISDVITRYVGSMPFVVFHLLLFTFWATANVGLIPGLTPFDPFPFGILTLIVSAEGVFLAIFILISQNRMGRQADRRSHLELQVSMLAEQEMTMLLKMQQKLCDQFGIDVDAIKSEAERLMEETDVEELVVDLEEKLPDP